MDNVYGNFARHDERVASLWTMFIVTMLGGVMNETAALKTASLWTVFMITLLGVMNETAAPKTASLWTMFLEPCSA